MSTRRYRGSVRPGRGSGAPRMSMPGVLDAFGAIVDFAPVPGTLNVVLHHDIDAGVLDRHLPASAFGPTWGAEHEPAGFWWAPVRIAHRYRGIAFQAEEAGYPRDMVELVASVRLRDALEVDDGDVIEFEVRRPRTT